MEASRRSKAIRRGDPLVVCGSNWSKLGATSYKDREMGIEGDLLLTAFGKKSLP